MTLQSIRALNRYQQPRSIYVISPDVDSCVEKLQTAASNVRCLHEDSILPGITLQSIDDTLKGLYPALETRSFEKGRTPAGWYFQQVRLPICVCVLPGKLKMVDWLVKSVCPLELR